MSTETTPSNKTTPSTTREDLSAFVDGLVSTAGHDGPAWPNASGSHCGTCQRRKTFGFQFIYGNNPAQPMPSIAPEPLTPTEAAAVTARFSDRYPQLTASFAAR